MSTLFSTPVQSNATDSEDINTTFEKSISCSVLLETGRGGVYIQQTYGQIPWEA